MKQLVNILCHILHTEPLVIGDKTDLRIGDFRGRFHVRWCPLCHIVAKRLGINLLAIVIDGFNYKLFGKDIGKFASVAILTAPNLLFALVVICGCQEFPEYKFRNP